MTKDELMRDVQREWASLYHNATLKNSMPQFDSKKEYDAFWDFLAEQRYMYVHEIEEEIKDRWEFFLTLEYYGRNGATLAPLQWHNGGRYRQDNISLDFGKGFDGFNALRFALLTLRYINTQTRTIAGSMPLIWRAEKGSWGF